MLKFRIVYLTWNGDRRTVEIEAQSAPAAVEEAKRKANRKMITWYTLVDVERITDD